MKNVSQLILITLGLAFGFLQANAQEEAALDLVTFKDKSQYRGTISEYKPDEYLRMKVGGQDLIIEGEQLRLVKKVAFNHYDFYKSRNPFWKEVQVGISGGKSNGFSSTETYPLAHVIAGYQFSQYLGLGLGTGFQRFSRIDIIPVYATIRGDLLDTRVTPLYYGDIGYGVGLARDNDFFSESLDAKGGFLVGTGMGVKVNMRSFYLVSTIGYKFQKSSTTREFTPIFFDTRFAPSGGEQITERRNYNRVEWKIGIGF